jgi:hypothetical protein
MILVEKLRYAWLPRRKGQRLVQRLKTLWGRPWIDVGGLGRLGSG